MSVKGLAALADFLKWEYPNGCGDLFSNVLNEQVVLVSTRPLGPWLQRPNVAKAAFEEVTRFPFGQYVGQEAFTIGMQVGFVPDETTAKLLQLVGTIEDAKVATLQDRSCRSKVTAWWHRPRRRRDRPQPRDAAPVSHVRRGRAGRRGATSCA